MTLRPMRPLLAAFAIAAAVPAAHADLTPVTSVEGITEFRLDNGLRILLFPDPSKQTVTVNVTYLVGSRHEGRGEKGMAHLLEHMLFKGTPTHDDVWGLLEDHGASFNGTTWVDRTNYYETLPASDENLEFALRMEADRMVNSTVAAEDLATEMTVVRNEFEMGENSAMGVLMERLLSSAFLWHNYGFSTIGNRSDIERVPIENLQRFYRKYYQPDNAMLVVAGRFEPGPTLALIEDAFGSIPRPQRTLEPTWTEEPVQDGARFVELSRVGSEQACGAVYHIPAGSHADYPAVELLADILTTEPSGPVYQALVPTELAVGVQAFSFAWREPGVLMCLANCSLNQDVRAAHDRMTRTIEAVADGGITDEAVERARTKRLKNIKLSLTDSGRIGVELSEWEALGDWRLFFVHRDRLKEISADDVRRVAAQYLVSSNRTSGVFSPVAAPQRAVIPATPDVSSIVEGYVGSESIAAGEAFEPTPENIERRTRRETLAGGIEVAMLPKETRGDKVVATFSFRFGTEATMKDHLVAFEMLPQLLMRGTNRLGFQALQDEIDRLKAQMNVGGGPGRVQGRIVTDRANLVASIELLGEILRDPALPEDQFELIRSERLAELERGLTDPQALLFTAVMRAMSPFEADSIHYVPTIEEQMERAGAVTLEELRDVWRRFYGASNAEVAVVGDFDPAEIRDAITATFGSWPSSSPYRRVVKPFRRVQAMDETINTPDKQMAMVAMGTTLEMRDDDPDYPALEFANYVLGRSAKSRLLDRLRHKGGLSYGAGSMLQVDSQDERAGLLAFAICAPQNAVAAQTAMHEELRRWIEEGVTEQELTEGRESYILQLQNTLASDEFVAGTLLEGLEIDRTFEYHERLMNSIEHLDRTTIADVLKQRLSSAPLIQFKAGDLEKSDG